MKNVVVTGAAGFIGSHICNKFLSVGSKVIGLDNFDPYYSSAIKKFNLSSLVKHKNFRFEKENILNQKGISALLKKQKPSLLVHCAAKVGVTASVKTPFDYLKTNLLGTQILLESIRGFSPKTKSILFSSSSVYGVQRKTPFAEKTVLNPQSPYGASKLAMEIIAKQYQALYGLSIAIVRPFTIYGPRVRPDMAPFLLIKAAETNKAFIKFGRNNNNARDWTYIYDLVDGVFKAAKNFHFRSLEIFNFGSGNPIGIDTFVSIGKRLVKKYLNKNLKTISQPRRGEELPLTHASISKAQRMLGYHPKTTIEEGLERFFKFYVSHRDFYFKMMKSKES